MKKKLTYNDNPEGPRPRRTVARRVRTLGAILLLACGLGVTARAQTAAPLADTVVAADPALPAPLAQLIAADASVQRIALPLTVVPLGVSEEWGPQPTGYVEALPAGAQPAEAWQSRPDGSAVLRLEFTSANAKGLRVQLRGALDGLELRVYDPEGPAVLGPYTSFPGVWEDGEKPSWWTPTIFGSSIGLEFYQPTDRPSPPSLPELAAICYLYDEPPQEEDPLLGSCLMDVTCQAAWATEARAIGRMNYIDGGGSFVCTGAMLNRSPQDFSPIFMTARHCINNQAAANSLEVHWRFQTPTCNGTPPALNTLPRNNGSLLLKTHRDSDWALVGLYQPSQTDAYLGWDTNYWTNNSAATGIHHPRGEFKRIHFGTKASDTTCFSTDGAVQSNRQSHVTATQGAARRGSSGSPAFDVNRRVRGTMSCGPGGTPEPMTCPPNEWKTYGRLDAAFPIVQWYISQMASPVYADRNFVGDPGEDGDRERGTLTNPFNRIYKATFCVRSGDTINIRAGSYNERFTLSRPMTLRAVGGTVTIGQ